METKEENLMMERNMMNGFVVPKPYDLEKRLLLLKHISTLAGINKNKGGKERLNGNKLSNIKLQPTLFKPTLETLIVDGEKDFEDGHEGKDEKRQNKPRGRHTQTDRSDGSPRKDGVFVPKLLLPEGHQFSDVSLNTERSEIGDNDVKADDSKIKKPAEKKRKRSLGFRLRTFLSRYLCPFQDFTQ